MLKKDKENIENDLLKSWASLIWSACTIAFFITIPVFCVALPYNYYGMAMVVVIPTFPIVFIGALIGLYFFRKKRIAAGFTILFLFLSQWVIFGRPISFLMLANSFYYHFLK